MSPAMKSEDQDQAVIDKQPIKWMELPIMKFNEVAVPHHVNHLKSIKANIQKCQRSGDWSGAYREQTNANIVIKQLRTLVKEMDVLRSRVIDSDVHKFDKLINNSRQSALNILQEFIDLSHQLSSSCNNVRDDNYISAGDSNGNSDNSQTNSDRDIRVDNQQYQLQQTLEISRLSAECQEQERCAVAWENLQREVEEVQQLYEELASIVHTQDENVNHIEHNVETGHENVVEGEKVLLKAARLKVTSYPFAGAVIGSCLGGPVGVIAGFKLGGIVALACSILGFTGGKILKEKQNAQLESHPHAL